MLISKLVQIPCSCRRLFLTVPVVILSAAKDPEEFNPPKPSLPLNPYHSAPWPLPVLSNFKTKASFRPKLLTPL